MESSLLLLSSPNFARLDSSVQLSVYREYYRMVYPQIMYMVKDHGVAEDIIQETFLKTVETYPQVENVAQLKGWIKVVVRNTVYNYFRKYAKKRNHIPIDSVYLDDSLNYATEVESVEEEIEIRAITEAIGEYLLDLKPEYRILIEMRWKQGLSYKEIAENLDITESAVKSKLFRAREAIKKRFHKEWGDH